MSVPWPPSRRRSGGLAVLSGLVALGLSTCLIGTGCGDDADASQTPDEDPVEDSTGDPASVGSRHGEKGPGGRDYGPAHVPEEPVEHGLRVSRVTGGARLGETRLAASTNLAPGDEILVEDGAVVVLDTRQRARFEVRGPATARVGGDVDAQLILLSGIARGILPPEGGSSRPPLRIAGPTATAEVGGSGDIWFVALPSGAGWVAVLSGTVDVFSGGADDDRRLIRSPVHAGQAAVSVDGVVHEPTPGPGGLEEAQAATTAMQSAASPAAEAQLVGALSTATATLDEAMGWLSEEREAGADLTERHRRAVAEGSDQAAELQRELVFHSQRRARLRRLVLSRWERVVARAGHLHLSGASVDGEPVASRASRVRLLLGD